LVTGEVADKAPAPRGAGAQWLERTLDIIELLGRSENELGITEIAAEAGLANGAVHRLLSTLTRRGYARRNPLTRKDELGLKAFALASSVWEILGPLARPFLEELTEVSHESSNLARLDKKSVVYIEQVPGPRMVRMFTEPGSLGYVRFLDWRLYGEEALPRREVAVWLQPESLTLEYGGRPLSAYDVELSRETGKPEAVGGARLFETTHALPQLRLFTLGDGKWLKAMKLEGYVSRKPAGPMALQEVLFPFLDAL
jgi:hypothetical protein